MPDPISSANSSVFDRTQLISDASCDPSTTTCGPTPPAKVVTVAPVLIEGEASKNELVAAYDKGNRRAPECRNEAMAAATGCGTVALSAVGTLAASPSGVGLVVGAGITAFNIGNCWRLIDDYTDCRDVGAARADVSTRCEERGGVPLSGVDAHEIVCLMGAR